MHPGNPFYDRQSHKVLRKNLHLHFMQQTRILKWRVSLASFLKECPFIWLTLCMIKQVDIYFLRKRLVHDPSQLPTSMLQIPNVFFFCQIGDLLTSCSEGILILGGDFNIPLNPLLDTTSGTSVMSYRVLKQIKLQLQCLMLHDTLQTLYPQDKDYTYFSTLHQKYTQIDYFFILHYKKEDA